MAVRFRCTIACQIVLSTCNRRILFRRNRSTATNNSYQRSPDTVAVRAYVTGTDKQKPRNDDTNAFARPRVRAYSGQPNGGIERRLSATRNRNVCRSLYSRRLLFLFTRTDDPLLRNPVSGTTSVFFQDARPRAGRVRNGFAL